MTRQRLTKFEYATIFLEQKGKCGCGCGKRLEQGKVDEEHTIPNHFKPGKPDTLWRRDCHKAKTKKDKADIAKVERMALRKGQQARRAKRDRPLLQTRNDLGGEGYLRRKAWKEKWQNR